MPSLLFVCVANSCRSQMAEAIAKSLVGDSWEIWSAGSRPNGQVHPLARTLMKEIGLDVSQQRSKGLDAVPKSRWDYVVTMGCGDACPHVDARQRIDWDLPDPVGLPIEEARYLRDQIIDRVQKLLANYRRNRNRAPRALIGLLVCSVLASRSFAAEQSKEPIPPRIDHILLEVKDLNRSIAFYRDQLGLKLTKRSGDFVTLEAVNIGVYLWSKRWSWSPAPPTGGRSPQGMYPHFVISDVKSTMERLRQAGYRIVADAKDYDYGTEGFVADPDGFVWALVSR